MSAPGCCATLLSVIPLKEGYLIGNRSGTLGGFGPGSLDLMTNFLSCFMPQAVKRQSRCPEVPYHRTGGSTAYTSCWDRVSNWEQHTLATRQQIKAHFLSRKLTTFYHSLKSDFQSISGVILWSSVGFFFSHCTAVISKATEKKVVTFAPSADIQEVNLKYALHYFNIGL